MSPQDESASPSAPHMGELRRALHDIGIHDADHVVHSARQWVQMPDEMPGLWDVAHTVHDISPYLYRLIEYEPTRAIERWASGVCSIPADDRLWSDPRLHGVVYRGDHIYPPTRGWRTLHPVWCALWHTYQPADVPEARTYRHLQAHLLAAHIRLIMAGRRPRMSHRLPDASRFVRSIHQPDNVHYVINLTRHVDDVRDLCLHLADVKSAARRDIARDPLVHLGASYAEILSDAHDLGIEIFEGKTGGNKGNSGAHARGAIDKMYPDHGGYWQLLNTRLLISSWGQHHYRAYGDATSPQLRDALYESGIDPSEYEVQDTVNFSVDHLLGEDDDAKKPRQVVLKELPPLSTLYATARAKVARISMDAQRLRVDPARARVREICTVLATLDRVFSQASAHDRRLRRAIKSGRSNVSVGDVALLAAISLVTGTPVQHVRNVVLINSTRDLALGYQLAYNPAYRMWIRPRDPPPRHPLKNVGRQQSREMWPRVVFQDVFGIGEWLERQNQEAGRSFAKQFDKNIRRFRRVWRDRISPELRAAGVDTRWRNLDRLAGMLPSWMGWHEEGNHLPIAFLFGHDDPLSSTHAYYTSLKRSELADFYHDHMMKVWENMDRSDPTSRGLLRFCPPDVEIGENWVGNDRTPEATSVATLVEALRKRLERSESSNRAELIDRHNQLSAYTALGFAMATGARAVRIPVPDLRAIHQRTGTLALQEKDRADGAHARMVVLPQVVRDQIEAYRAHVLRLFAALPELPMEIKVAASKYSDRSRYNAASYALDLRHTLFFLDEHGQPQEWTGARVRQHCDELCPGHWPVDNAGRHLLRSFLANQGCPATLINTHLGHWHRGEESWGAASAMDPVAYRREILPYLDRLMGELRYQVMAP